MTSDTSTLLKKITVKDVLGMTHLKDKEFTDEIKKLAQDNTQLCVIGGEVTGYGEKSTANGPSTFFTGTLVAKNLRTGHLFRSGKAYLPNDIAENVKAMFQGQAGSGNACRFSAIVTVVPHAKSPVGYSYVSEPIKTVETVSREAELFAQLATVPSPKLIEKKKA